MILQALVEEYENLLRLGRVPREGWSTEKVSFTVELNPDGTIKAIVPIKEEVQSGKKTKLVPKPLSVPERQTRSSGIKPYFLCDNGKYIFGLRDESKDDEKKDRSKEYFESSKDLHLKILSEIDCPSAKAVCLFFEKWNPSVATDIKDIEGIPIDELKEVKIVFSFDGKYVHEDDFIVKAWEDYYSSAQDAEDASDADAMKAICLLTGKPSEIALIHGKISGVPGANSSGANIVAFNKGNNAFESYGNEDSQGYNAPIGQSAMLAYTKALNYLLSRNENRYSLNGSMIVYWAQSAEPKCEEIFSFALEPSRDNNQELKKVFDNLKHGARVDVDDINIDMNQNFYILCLAPNNARLSVRFFYQNTFASILSNIAQHYDRLRIACAKDDTYMNLYQLLQQTVNQKSDDKTPNRAMASKLLMAMITDDRYPNSLYTDVLERIRAERDEREDGKIKSRNITLGRVSIIKAYLIKNYNLKEGEKYMALNEGSCDIAYILGRLFAELEKVQKDASGTKLNSTIKDSYFNAACATPASVFPTILKLSNSHLKKISREKMWLKVTSEKTITELLSKIGVEGDVSFPKRLSLEDQGKFILGYYHQVQKIYEKKEDK